MAKSSAKGIRAGRTYVELFADDSRLVRGLRRAEKRIRAFGQVVTNIGKRMMMLGTAIVAPLLLASRSFAEAGDRLDKMSKRTGIAVEALSSLGFAAEQTGSSLEDVERGIFRMLRFLDEARQGSLTAQRELERLGVTGEALKGMLPDQQFKLLADRLSAMKDPGEAAALALRIFGRSAMDLIPLIRLGAGGISALEQQFKDLGLAMTGDEAKAAAEFRDMMNLLRHALRRVVVVIGGALVPVLKQVIERTLPIVRTVVDWLQANQRLIVSVLKIGAAVIGIGAALVVAGVSIKGFALALGGLLSVMKVLNVAFIAIQVAMKLLLTPIGIVAAALVSGAAAFVIFTETGRKTLGWLGERFKEFQDRATRAIGGIGDALASGDIALAAKVLWLTLKMEYLRGVAALKRIWAEFKAFFLRIANDTSHGAWAAGEIAFSAMKRGWIELSSVAGKVWNEISSFAASSWEKIMNVAEKGWLHVMGLFDETLDVELATNMADQQSQAKQLQIERDRQRKWADNEAERVRKRQAEEGRHGNAMAGIGERHAAMMEGINAEARSGLDAAQADVDAARKEWEDALKRAREGRDADAANPFGTSEADDWLRKFQEGLEGFDAAVEKVTARGTFSAAEAARLGPEKQDELRQLQDINRNTRELRNARGLAFT